MEARSWVWLPLVPEEPKVELEVFDDTVAVDVVRDDVVLDPEKESAEREAAAAAKALKTWTGKKGCVRRFLTAERAAAAGLDWTDYFDEDGSPFIESNTISKAVRRAERAADTEEARCIKESEAPPTTALERRRGTTCILRRWPSRQRERASSRRRADDP